MVETCDVCQFDAERWSDADLRTSLPAIPIMWRLALDGLSAEQLAVCAGGTDVEQLDRELEALAAGAPSRAAMLDAVHQNVHDMHLASRARHRVGAGAPAQAGVVAHLHRSDGGVPKTAVDAVEVGWSGVVGDKQNDRKHHGRPFQALCLWSVEVIEKLQVEGHPIQPGFAGENITIAGVDWSTLQVGTQLRIGEVDAEISAHAIPCAKNANWFADRNYNRILFDDHPGDSRLYAWVRAPGAVAVGDDVLVEP